jgi:hypothetical protein
MEGVEDMEWEEIWRTLFSGPDAVGDFAALAETLAAAGDRRAVDESDAAWVRRQIQNAY